MEQQNLASKASALQKEVPHQYRALDCIGDTLVELVFDWMAC